MDYIGELNGNGNLYCTVGHILRLNRDYTGFR